MGLAHLSENGLIAVTWVGAGLGITFALIRVFFIRLRRMNRLLADDYLILLALAFLIANSVLQTLQAPHLYYMLHNPKGPDIVEHSLHYTPYEFAVIGIFWSILWSIKGSFLALFYILLDGLPFYRRVWWPVTVFAFLAYVGCWLASVWTCHPPSDYFKYGKCTKPIDVRGSTISISYSTAVDIITDLMIMSLPMGLIWKAKMSLHQKAGLAVVFSLGLIIIAVAIIRAVEVTGKAYTDPIALAAWGVAESSISMIVGCLPPFKTLLSSKTGSTNNYGSSTTGYNRSYPGRSIPLQSRSMYQSLDEDRSHEAQITTLASDEGVLLDGSSLYAPGAGSNHDIRIVKEFSVVSSG